MTSQWRPDVPDFDQDNPGHRWGLSLEFGWERKKRGCCLLRFLGGSLILLGLCLFRR